MKLLTIVCAATLIFVSCEKEKKNLSGTTMDTGAYIYVLDEKGDDLLDPENDMTMDTSSIEIYDVIGEDTVLRYNPMMDLPKGFRIRAPFGPFDKYTLALGFNTLDQSEVTSTLVKWSETDTDVIKAEIERGSNELGDWLVSNKVWVNGDLIWDVDSVGRFDFRYFSIVK